MSDDHSLTFKVQLSEKRSTVWITDARILAGDYYMHEFTDEPVIVTMTLDDAREFHGWLTTVIRANAEKISDLEDVRDDLEAKVNALTAETEELRHLAMAAGEDADNWRAERDALTEQVASLREAGSRLEKELDAATARAERAEAIVARQGCVHGLTDWDADRQVYVCRACGLDDIRVKRAALAEGA